jgi:hypothetical protein|tara:strand:+ start:104 stop:853 length:750 start_codon:yes stop_codon:yes gene_type:complete
MKNKKISVAKAYRLKSEKAPLSFMIPTKSSRSYSLLYFDEEKNENRPLRYARNQKSPFEDEQDGSAILEPIVFEDGMLYVPANNPVLQEFLHYHPMNGSKFVEVDDAKDAEEEVEMLNLEVEALVVASQMSIDKIETLSRVLFGKDTSSISTVELKRDILIFAKSNPFDFLEAIDDPTMKVQGTVQLFFDKGLLTFRRNKKEIWFSTPSNKTRMLVVPFNEDPLYLATSYLQSDEGIESLKMLENLIEG